MFYRLRKECGIWFEISLFVLMAQYWVEVKKSNFIGSPFSVIIHWNFKNHLETLADTTCGRDWICKVMSRSFHNIGSDKIALNVVRI